MSTSLLQVRGIGPATAAILTENGITTAEELAKQTVRQVASIKTFSEVRAQQVIEDANALLTAETAPVAEKERVVKKAESKKVAKKDKKKPKAKVKDKKKEKAKEKQAKKAEKPDKKKKADKAAKKSDKNKKGKKSVKKNKK